MKLVLFVEGHTERALPAFFKRWLDSRLPRPVGIRTVHFNGWRHRTALPPRSTRPEEVNFDEPPGKLLGRLYREKLSRSYKKVIDGGDLFRALPPEQAAEKCPHLKSLLNDMLQLVQTEG